MFTQPPVDTETLKLFTDLGVVGVLLLLALAAVLLVWTRRNVRPIDPTTGTNAAIEAFAEMLEAQNRNIEADRELRKLENEANRKQIKELNEAYIESISANADATNRIADNEDKLTSLMAANHAALVSEANIIRTAVVSMEQSGSKPLQGLIETASRIEATLDKIVRGLTSNADMRHMHEKEIQTFQEALDALRADVMIIATSMQSRIDEKRKTTDTNKAVNTMLVQEPPPTPPL